MDPIAPLIRNLHDDGRLRVWSLVITVFGDAVQMRGGRVSTARLGRLLGRIGVEPGALRTALSRLGRDGWVAAERAGRLSEYRLTPQGRARFSDATHRIYAAPRVGPVTDWALSLEPPSDKPMPMLGGLVLRPADMPYPPASFRMVGQIGHMSAELRRGLIASAHLGALARLRADLAQLERVPADPLTAAAARTLLIHRWRRIVLRFPDLPVDLLPDDWQERPPRVAVARTWHRLTPQAEAWWDGGEPDLPAMRAPDAALFQRFGGNGA